MKKKLISIIIILLILTVLLVSLIPSDVKAVETAQELIQMGPAAVGKDVTITYKTEMNVASNEMIYCLQQGKFNGSTVTYRVGTYIEIADGIAKVWDYNGLVGATSDYAEENKILAEILTGNYGKKGFTIDGAEHNYTPVQRALYCYMDTWFNTVGATVGTAGWSVGNGYVDNGEGTDVVSKAKAAVEAGANPSAKILLLVNWEAKENWQKFIKVRLYASPYILVYLPHKKDVCFSFAKKLQAKTGYPIIYLSISPRIIKGVKTIYDASPEEWLSWIFYAEYVVTGSFHGTAFSINFEIA